MLTVFYANDMKTGGFLQDFGLSLSGITVELVVEGPAVPWLRLVLGTSLASDPEFG